MNRPQTDEWMANDPVRIWVICAFCPKSLLAPLLHVMGKYGIKGHAQHRMYKMADDAQTVMLRQLGDAMRKGGKIHYEQTYDGDIYLGEKAVMAPNPTEDDIFVWEFSHASPERQDAAKEWLWERYQLFHEG